MNPNSCNSQGAARDGVGVVGADVEQLVIDDVDLGVVVGDGEALVLLDPLPTLVGRRAPLVLQRVEAERGDVQPRGAQVHEIGARLPRRLGDAVAQAEGGREHPDPVVAAFGAIAGDHQADVDAARDRGAQRVDELVVFR
jgi:hypothetical protein